MASPIVVMAPMRRVARNYVRTGMNAMRGMHATVVAARNASTVPVDLPDQVRAKPDMVAHAARHVDWFTIEKKS